jgi:betaine-aldehyde dehydrogenase
MTHTKEQLFIGGGWVAPATTATIAVVSPHTTEVIGRVPDGHPADLDRAVDAARTAFDTGPWPRMAPRDRAAVLARLADAYDWRVGELTALINAQMGAPVAQPLQAAAAADLALLRDAG